MVSRTKRQNPPEESLQIPLKDIGEMVSPVIRDTGGNDSTDPKAIAAAFGEVIGLVEEGFKHETIKGQLYYALHHALSVVKNSVSQAKPGDASISIRKDTLELLNTGSCQLNEAALQYGGSKLPIPESLRFAFSNNGYGHGPEDKKYKADLLREMADKTMPAFFGKYKIGEVTHETLEFYDAPAPQQYVM